MQAVLARRRSTSADMPFPTFGEHVIGKQVCVVMRHIKRVDSCAEVCMIGRAGICSWKLYTQVLPYLLTSRPAQKDGLVLSVISLREGGAVLATGQWVHPPQIRQGQV